MHDEDKISRHEIAQGFLYDHSRINLNTVEVHNALANVEALLELLLEKGILSEEDFEKKRMQVDERLRSLFVEKGMAVALQEHESSKYKLSTSSKVDCENRIHLCRAACCRLQFALSKEDVEEGIVRWDLSHPYFIARRDRGNCAHLVPEAYTCNVYQYRPIPCRRYDCRKDERVWQDFQNKIVNPRLHENDWPNCLAEEKEAEE